MIETGEAGGYRSAIEPPQPSGLQASGPLVFEPIAGGWRGLVTIEGASDACDADVGVHLHTLVGLSRENPSWRITITLEPDGGVLELRAGSFSETDAQLEGVLSLGAHAKALAGDQRGFDRIYASMRLPPDAHQHFVDLVLKQVPSEWEQPVTQPSPDAVAIGFELHRDAMRTARVISILRTAWLDEGSGASCLVEVEGPAPVVKEVDSLRGWSELARATWAVEAVTTNLRTPPRRTRPASRDVVTRGPEVPVLGARMLTWLDERDLIRGLTSDGTIWDLSERTELRMVDPNGRERPMSFVRHRDGSVVFGSKELPPPAAGAVRRAHSSAHGVFITETQGEQAQLSFVSQGGLIHGPLLRRPVNIVRGGGLAFAVSEIADAQVFVTIEPGMGWDYGTPWPATTRVTDLAIPTVGAVVVVGDGVAHQLDAFTGELQRTIYLPCADPEIVQCESPLVWVTGRSAGGAQRHDLFRIELSTGRVTVETAAICSEGWGELIAVRIEKRWLLAYARRGVFTFEKQAAEPLLSVESGDEIVELCQWDALTAAFAATSGGTRVSLGEGDFQTVFVAGVVRWPLVDAN